MTKKVDLVVDMQYGSTGKGLICGYLSESGDYDVVISANMPNAGHTYIDSEGQIMIHKVLPSGICHRNVRFVLIGPGAVFKESQLSAEILEAKNLGYSQMGYLHDVQIAIHPNATVLLPEHVEMESDLDNIGSTKQGAAAATVDKMVRKSGNMPLATYADEATSIIANYVVTHDEYMAIILEANHILAEGSQGYHLGINTQFYPYVTSRSCTPAAFLDYMGIPVQFLNEVIGTMRTYPIRVGGTSGPWFADQDELTWADLGQEPERTTVTNRERRVATISREQTADAMVNVRPDHVFLNFCNYCKTEKELQKIVQMINEMDGRVITKVVSYLGFGPRYSDIQEIGDAGFNAHHSFLG